MNSTSSNSKSLTNSTCWMSSNSTAVGSKRSLKKTANRKTRCSTYDGTTNLMTSWSLTTTKTLGVLQIEKRRKRVLYCPPNGCQIIRDAIHTTREINEYRMGT